MDKVLLVIPAYNEEKNIERVVDQLTESFPELDYIVVNDGSKDGLQRSAENGATVFWIFRSIWDWPAVFRPG